MTQTPLQQLTAKIYASNPELMTLGVGCEIQSDDKKYIIDDKLVQVMNFGQIQYYDIDIDMFPKFLLSDEYDIIGKPPTLVDVLKWLKIKFKNINLFISYRFQLLELWNLNSIYLRDQSPELINFLINLNNG